jgi:hypothetical protein
MTIDSTYGLPTWLTDAVDVQASYSTASAWRAEMMRPVKVTPLRNGEPVETDLTQRAGFNPIDPLSVLAHDGVTFDNQFSAVAEVHKKIRVRLLTDNSAERGSFNPMFQVAEIKIDDQELVTLYLDEPHESFGVLMDTLVLEPPDADELDYSEQIDTHRLSVLSDQRANIKEAQLENRL